MHCCNGCAIVPPVTAHERGPHGHEMAFEKFYALAAVVPGKSDFRKLRFSFSTHRSESLVTAERLHSEDASPTNTFTMGQFVGIADVSLLVGGALPGLWTLYLFEVQIL